MAVAGPAGPSGFNIGLYDEIQFDGSGLTEDVYTYYYNTVLMATKTITFTDATKKVIVSTVLT